MQPAVLATHRHQGVGFVLFFEGWRVAWTNRQELATDGNKSWIGTEEGERVVRLGLEIPDSIRMSINLEEGLLADDEVSFTLLDHKKDIIALFDESTEPTQVYGRVSPEDIPAPAQLPGTTEGELVDLFGKFLNGESIGPAGERRQFQVFPGAAGQLPGFDHATTSSQEQEQFLLPSAVSDSPRWYDGRRVSLYLIRQDVDGTWPSWSDQDASGCARIWWGTARYGRVSGYAWTISCDGPGSWLRAALNRNRSAAWSDVTPALVLAAGEGLMFSAFSYVSTGGVRTTCGDSTFDPVDDLIAATGDAAKTVASAISQRLTDVAAIVDGESFVGYRDGYVAVQVGAKEGGGEEVVFQLQVSTEVPQSGADVWVALHEKVWRWLGWDPLIQHRPTSVIAGGYEVEFKQLKEVFVPWDDGPVAMPPTGGYWAARFTTLPIGVPDFSNVHNHNDGKLRAFTGVDGTEASIIDPNGGLMAVSASGVEPPYIGEQRMRPVDDVSIFELGPCDRTGFIALRGMYRESADAEPELRYQLFKASWVDNGNGTVEIAANGKRWVYLSQMLEPRPFGLKNPETTDPNASQKLTRPWASRDLAWASVVVFGHDLATSGDRAELVLLRLLLSTGTGRWDAVGESADNTFTVGLNAHPDAAGSLGDDREVADISLGIPAALVDHKSFVTTANLLGGKGAPLRQCRLVRLGNVPAQDLVAAVLAPRGWAIGLQGGRYTLWARGTPLNVGESVAALTQADLDSDDLPHVEPVDLYPLSPIDQLLVTYGANPIGDGEGRELVGQARDGGAWRRHGGARKEIDGSGLTATPTWVGAWRKRWEVELAQWFATPHTMITLPVKHDRARNLWPGSIITYGSPWPANREGSYGLSGQLGRVISIERNLREAGTCTVRVLLQPGDPVRIRRFAPIARVVDNVDELELRHNAATRQLFCYGNAFLREGDASDVAAFAPPAWLAVGGDAVVYGYQQDGRTWSHTFTCRVQDVDAGGHVLRYKAGSFSGKFWERRFTVLALAPYDDQDANSWPRALFGVMCKPTGKFGAGNTPGFKLL